MRNVWVASIAVGTLAFVAGCATSSGSPSGDLSATQGFTCCTSADVSAIRHPGESMSVHWFTPTTTPALPKTTTPVSLNAFITGPFKSASDVKVFDAKAAHLYRAPMIATTTASNAPPVSTIAIPGNAPVGFYNLTTAVQSGNATASGSSIIQVR